MTNIEAKVQDAQKKKGLRDTLDGIKRSVDSINFRVALGIMPPMMIPLFAFGIRIINMDAKLDDIRKNQQRYELKVERENVLGGTAPEEFYEIDGKRAYISIDGKSLAELYKK